MSNKRTATSPSGALTVTVEVSADLFAWSKEDRAVFEQLVDVLDRIADTPAGRVMLPGENQLRGRLAYECWMKGDPPDGPPAPAFQCPDCDHEPFASQAALSGHRRIHRDTTTAEPDPAVVDEPIEVRVVPRPAPVDADDVRARMQEHSADQAGRARMVDALRAVLGRDVMPGAVVYALLHGAATAKSEAAVRATVRSWSPRNAAMVCRELGVDDDLEGWAVELRAAYNTPN